MTFVPFLLDLCSWSIKTNNVEVGDKQVVSCDSYLGTFFYSDLLLLKMLPARLLALSRCCCKAKLSKLIMFSSSLQGVALWPDMQKV